MIHLVMVERFSNIKWYKYNHKYTGTSDTQFFFNTITESQHSSTRQVIFTFTFVDGRTDELTIKMHGSGTGGGEMEEKVTIKIIYEIISNNRVLEI